MGRKRMTISREEAFNRVGVNTDKKSRQPREKKIAEIIVPDREDYRLTPRAVREFLRGQFRHIKPGIKQILFKSAKRNLLLTFNKAEKIWQIVETVNGSFKIICRGSKKEQIEKIENMIAN